VRSATVLDLESIVTNGLCIGCGLCQSLAGHDRLRLVMTPEGRERPMVIDSPGNEALAKINAVCPGITITGPDAGDGLHMDVVWGPATRLSIGYAGDPDIRFMSATGGVLTALAVFLLETSKVECVLHVAPLKDKPMRSGAHVSRNRADALAGSGSHYGPSAPLTGVMELLDRGQPFAVVAKPCDIGALRNLASIDSRVDELVRYSLVMVCGGASEFTKTLDLIGDHGLNEDDVTHLRYRGYGNPGPTTIETRDGRRFQHGYAEMWEDEGTWRVQNRCKICPDAIGELADIAASDVWPGGGPSGEDDGFNGIIARTAAGRDLLAEAVESGAIVINEEIGFRDMDVFQPHQVRKKRAVYDRLLGMADAGVPVPTFRNLRLAELAEGAEPEIRRKNREGMAWRIGEGKTSEPLPTMMNRGDNET